MKDTIMEMPDYQRPYEKCLREGEQSLSDRELLAVILRCGVQGLSSLTLADKILNLSEQTGHSGLLGLFHASVPELMKIHGIGKVKAIQLKCIGELSKRMATAAAKPELSFHHPVTNCKVLYGTASSRRTGIIVLYDVGRTQSSHRRTSFESWHC